MTQGQEVKFHEIKIHFFMRSKFTFSWDQNEICSLDQICSLICDSFDQEVDTLIMRSKFKKRIIRNFDLMINLLVPSTIMRLKFKINNVNLVSCTCGSFLALIISHLCVHKHIWSHDCTCGYQIDHEVKFP